MIHPALIDAAAAGKLETGGQTMINMASNDYLGFARDPQAEPLTRTDAVPPDEGSPRGLKRDRPTSQFLGQNDRGGLPG